MQVGKNSQKFTEGGPTPDDAGALLFQKCRRVSGRIGDTKRHFLLTEERCDVSVISYMTFRVSYYGMNAASENLKAKLGFGSVGDGNVKTFYPTSIGTNKWRFTFDFNITSEGAEDAIFDAKLPPPYPR